MAEGGTPQNVYNVHVEGGGTFIAGDHVREKSEITVPQGSNAENKEGGVENYEVGQSATESSQAELERQVPRPEPSERDLTWLAEGKIVMYKKRFLSEVTKTVRYGRQHVLREHWREIAVKLIQSEDNKCLNELKLLMKLSHPNIVHIYDAGEFPGALVDYIYIVMELCSQNLRTYVEENDFNFQTSFSFIRQIIEGLIYLHDNNVTHRDLKPDNVLISLCKKFAKLSDFGLSKEIPEGRSKATVTTIGAGTEGYRAPETYQNISHVTPSIDVFSFGLVTHFTFTKGKHPFGDNPYECTVNIMKNQNRDFSQIPEFEQPHSHKKEQLINLLHQTLEPKPKERPTMKDTKRSAFIAGGLKDSTDILQGLDACQPKATSDKGEEETVGGVVEGSTSALEEPKLSAIPIRNVEETEQPEGAAAPSSDTEHAGDAVERTAGVVEESTSSASPSSDVKESEKSEVAAAPSNVTDETVETAVNKVAVNDVRMQKSEASAGDGGDGEVEEDVSPSSEVKDSEQSEEAAGSSNATEETGGDVRRTTTTLAEMQLSASPSPSSNVKESEESEGGAAHSNVAGGGSSEIDVMPMGRIQKIQDQLKKPLNEIGFPRFAQLLSELRELRGFDDLDTLLQTVECELQLARGKEEESIARTREFISAGGLFSAVNVKDIAYDLQMSKSYVRSLILYRISNDLYETQNVSPDDVAKWIRDRVVDVSYAAQPLIEAGGRSRDIGIKYGLEYMESLVIDLRSIESTTPNIRALNEADSLCSISFLCNVARKYQNSFSFGLKGLEVLAKQIRGDASKYKIKGILMQNLGVARQNSGDYSFARLYYDRSIEAKEQASDFENDNVKLESIETTRRNLENTHKLLAKQK